MFAVNSIQNQICLPVTHLMSTLGGIRFSIRTSTNSRKDNEVRVEVDLSKDKKLENSLELLLNYPENQWRTIGLCPFCIKESNRSKLPSRWRQSYLSTPSFFENKHGFSDDFIYNPIHYYISLKNSAPKFKTSAGIHWKGFKTIRSRSIEGLNSQTLKTEVETSFAQKIFNLYPWRGSKDKSKLGTEAEQHEKLKGLLAEGDISPENQQKMKVAFAEGYIASDGRNKPESRLRFLPIVRDLMGIILILGLLFSLIGGTFRLQINNSNSVHPEDINVTFADVKGVEEAKQELQEIVEFLRNPEKFSALGGVLLVGPPGTGKTLLGRAVAGEAGVAFFHAAGPEFDEVLVGQGARRVRDLFSAAKARAPCVIFIDEIDSVGAKRTNSVLHPYANQTINQLLSEMDGFRQNEGVIVLGATNRREDLDKALLRPGRFDIEVHVPIPDLKGRTEILELYLGKVKLADDVDMDVLARGTTGFTGADIENLVNQAAIRAAVDQAPAVSMKYLENSRDKVLMGPERKSRIPDEEANKITAYHESGHAIVSFFTRDAHPLHKITIIPRGPSLGHASVFI
ncbi:ATP-dependent zinc metalloprotease yme1l [Chamberlinius hualienensis]